VGTEYRESTTCTCPCLDINLHNAPRSLEFSISVWQSTNSLAHKLIKNVLTARWAAVAHTRFSIGRMPDSRIRESENPRGFPTHVDAENYAFCSRTLAINRHWVLSMVIFMYVFPAAFDTLSSAERNLCLRPSVRMIDILPHFRRQLIWAILARSTIVRHSSLSERL